MSWKYDDKHCVCGEVSEEYVLLYCNLYMGARRRWKEKLVLVNVDVYNAIKGYEADNDCIERETMWYLGMVWKAKQAIELSRLGLLHIMTIMGPLLTYSPYTCVKLVEEQS